METVTSLVLLTIFVVPPITLAGKEAIELLIIKANRSIRTGGNLVDNEQKTDSVYDGMNTVEIPVYEPQVIAYESVLPNADEHIEIIESTDRAFKA